MAVQGMICSTFNFQREYEFWMMSRVVSHHDITQDSGFIEQIQYAVQCTTMQNLLSFQELVDFAQKKWLDLPLNTPKKD
jgi:hypothetical protein